MLRILAQRRYTREWKERVKSHIAKDGARLEESIDTFYELLGKLKAGQEPVRHISDTTRDIRLYLSAIILLDSVLRGECPKQPIPFYLTKEKFTRLINGFKRAKSLVKDEHYSASILERTDSLEKCFQRYYPTSSTN